MSTSGLRAELREIIARSGYAVTGVVSDLPEAAHWLYTIGNPPRGLPELIVFGEETSVAGHLLNDINDRLRAGSVLARPGVTIPAILGAERDLPVRLGAVLPEWAERYGPRAGWYHRVPGETVRFLQVIVPDLEGRFPEHPDYDAWSIELQPDLSRPLRPWLGPLVPWHDPGDGPPIDALVRVPILTSVEPEDRDELVPVRRDADGRWVVARPAVLASTVTVGTVLALDPDVVPTDRLGDLDVLPAAEVAEQGWWISLHLRVTGAAGSWDEMEERVRDVLAPFEPDVAVTFGRCSVHVDVNPALATRVRLKLRPLVRDGAVAEIEPYHRATCSLFCDCGP